MTNNTVKPKKKTAKKAAAKSGIAPNTAPEDVQNEPLEAVAPRGSTRISMHGSVGQDVPKEATDPNFHFRWCADYDKGKIQRYQGAWWEFVMRDGEKIKRPGGEPLYLMKIPKKYREQDLLAKRKKIIDINKQMQSDSKVDSKSSVPDYIPKGQDSVTERDNL